MKVGKSDFSRDNAVKLAPYPVILSPPCGAMGSTEARQATVRLTGERPSGKLRCLLSSIRGKRMNGWRMSASDM